MTITLQFPQKAARDLLTLCYAMPLVPTTTLLYLTSHKYPTLRAYTQYTGTPSETDNASSLGVP